VGRLPTPPAIAPDGSRAYLALEGDAAVAVVDLRTDSVLARWATGRRPFTAVLNPSGSALYVPNHDAATVSVVDTSSGLTVLTLLSGLGSRQVLGGRSVYVVSSRAGTITSFADVAWQN